MLRWLNLVGKGKMTPLPLGQDPVIVFIVILLLLFLAFTGLWPVALLILTIAVVAANVIIALEKKKYK